MIRRFVILEAAIALAACAPPSSTPAPRRSAIINGVDDSGHPEVGLFFSQGTACCTATLIGNRTVLTAAHCLADEDYPPYTILEPFEVELGGKMRAAESQQIHPDYVGYSAEFDVAVLRLSEPVTGITPALVADAAPSVGEVITLVGFGCSTEGWGSDKTFGTKRKADNTISAVENTQFSYPDGATVGWLCDGDSGGPSFTVRDGVALLVGVHSYDLDESGHDQRADAFRSWIAEQAGGDLYQGPAKTEAGTIKRDAGPASADGRDPSSSLDGAGGTDGDGSFNGDGCHCAVARRSNAPSATLLPALLLVVLAAWSRGRRRRGADR